MDTAVSVALPTPIRIPVAAWLLAALAVMVMYIVTQENGLVLANAWEPVHEFFHDGRHPLGVPCH